MLTVHKCSEKGIFSHLSNHAFCRLYFLKYISYEAHLFFWKRSKFPVEFRNVEKGWTNIIGIVDNCIWIDCIKHSLLQRDNTSNQESMC